MDSTFRTRDKRILLFIVMGVNKQFQSVPFAFICFSMPGGNQANHTGYNAAILMRMLSAWSNSMSVTKFIPAVATTNTDVKERNALRTVFPTIYLLIPPEASRAKQPKEVPWH